MTHHDLNITVTGMRLCRGGGIGSEEPVWECEITLSGNCVSEDFVFYGEGVSMKIALNEALMSMLDCYIMADEDSCVDYKTPKPYGAREEDEPDWLCEWPEDWDNVFDDNI